MPFRNSETDVYYQIAKIDEISELSNTSLKTMRKNKNWNIKETGLDNLSNQKQSPHQRERYHHREQTLTIHWNQSRTR